MRITVHQYNDKYLIELEGGAYKQTFKIGTEAVGNPDVLKTICNEEFIQNCIARFRTMHADFHTAFKTINK